LKLYFQVVVGGSNLDTCITVDGDDLKVGFYGNIKSILAFERKENIKKPD
jgi:hypothetical protein